MAIIAATAVEVPVAYDVTLDSWVIDVRPTCVNAGGTIMLDVGGSPGPSKAKCRMRAAEGCCQNGYAAGCVAVLPVRRVLMGSVKRSLKGRLACCAKAAGSAKGHLQISWWRRRRRGITAGKEKKKKKPSTSADRRCSLRASLRDRDEQLADAISYCKATMGYFTTPGD